MLYKLYLIIYTVYNIRHLFCRFLVFAGTGLIDSVLLHEVANRLLHAKERPEARARDQDHQIQAQG